ncbi:MAG TPA: class I SAM-dependent methyltransferase [Thermoanaerobaculia bacterium]
MKSLRKIAERLIPVLDVFIFLLVYPAAFLLKIVRKGGVHRMPLSKRALLSVGVFPIRNQYYEPQFDTADLRPGSVVRPLPGIDWNIDGQLALLEELHYADEVRKAFNEQRNRTKDFRFGNGAFEAGDAEFWYSIVRHVKPRNIIEIGSGNSTLVARLAIEANAAEAAGYACRHTCIEPYEAPWLESTGVSLIRRKVEDVDQTVFATLGRGDILFIDSTHMIKPQGDVLVEFLEILPKIPSGVIVHVHDIFSPRGYLDEWVKEKVFFWNEQFLLEAFLSHNRDWKVLAALNYLHHDYAAQFKAVCPFVTPQDEPGSFYLERL